jgi:hypothetical protein
MIDNFNAILERNFDKYARNAQLKPGLLIVVPAVVTLIAFVPGALDVAKAFGGVVVQWERPLRSRKSRARAVVGLSHSSIDLGVACPR